VQQTTYNTPVQKQQVKEVKPQAKAIASNEKDEWESF